MLRNVRSFVYVSKKNGTRSSFYLIELGDPADDLAVATVLMMVGGQLVLLRPRKVRHSKR